MKTVTVNLPAIAVFVRKFGAEKEAKDSFYDDLQDAIDSAPSGDMLIVAVYWNTLGHGNMAQHGDVHSGSEVR